MKAIVISSEEFLVNTLGQKNLGIVDGIEEYILIDRKKVCTLYKAGGGKTENVPLFWNGGAWRMWEDNSKKFEIIDLESNGELLNLFNRVYEGYKAQFY